MVRPEDRTTVSDALTDDRSQRGCSTYRVVVSRPLKCGTVRRLKSRLWLLAVWHPGRAAGWCRNWDLLDLQMSQ